MRGEETAPDAADAVTLGWLRSLAWDMTMDRPYPLFRRVAERRVLDVIVGRNGPELLVWGDDGIRSDIAYDLTPKARGPFRRLCETFGVPLAEPTPVT